MTHDYARLMAMQQKCPPTGPGPRNWVYILVLRGLKSEKTKHNARC